MNRDLNDLDYAEERLRASTARDKATGLDILCEVLVQSPSEDRRLREWVPASEWTQFLPPLKSE
jgi:hypothetical protein